MSWDLQGSKFDLQECLRRFSCLPRIWVAGPLYCWHTFLMGAWGPLGAMLRECLHHVSWVPGDRLAPCLREVGCFSWAPGDLAGFLLWTEESTSTSNQ